MLYRNHIIRVLNQGPNIHWEFLWTILNVFYQQVGDVRVQFSYAGLSGKPGSGLGDPMKVSF